MIVGVGEYLAAFDTSLERFEFQRVCLFGGECFYDRFLWCVCISGMKKTVTQTVYANQRHTICLYV